jgi:hypothetical protein
MEGSDHAKTSAASIWFPMCCHSVGNAIGYARFYSRSHHALIRVYDAAGNVIETDERKGDFKEP